MIISTIKDGFGNQLFMYACAYSVAKNSGSKLVIDTSFLATSKLRNYELGRLNIKYDYLFHIPNYIPNFLKILIRKLFQLYIKLIAEKYNERKSYEFDSKVLKLKGSYRLYGYWQSEKYFVQYRKELLDMLIPNYDMTDSFKTMLSKIQNTQSVSIHVRRGDFIALGFCLNDEYYKKAIQYIIERIKNPIFYVFSDDIEYAKKMFSNFDVAIEIINYKSIDSTVEDFLLMKSCKHNIIANSTYSWWGAWANCNPDKIVICPPRESPDFFLSKRMENDNINNCVSVFYLNTYRKLN